MPSGKTRIAIFALIGLSALLVGFHGASTLMTLTQIGASPTKPQLPKAHASLAPKPALPLQVSEPAKTRDTIDAQPAAPPPAANPQPAVEAVPAPALDAVAPPSANLSALAAATMAEADRVEVPEWAEEPPPRRERRRYRAPRPDLHRVY